MRFRTGPRIAAPAPSFLTAALVVVLALAGSTCNRAAPAQKSSATDQTVRTGSEAETPRAAVTNPAADRRVPTAARSSARDLSEDESLGGHTLARHVGKTDQELTERLHREPQISSASTYTDRATAERVVGAALAAAGRSFSVWRARTGRRPNFVLHYTATAPVGRSLSRRRPEATPCARAVVVLRWDDRRDRFFVLTSYPEEDR